MTSHSDLYCSVIVLQGNEIGAFCSQRQYISCHARVPRLATKNRAESAVFFCCMELTAPKAYIGQWNRY